LINAASEENEGGGGEEAAGSSRRMNIRKIGNVRSLLARGIRIYKESWEAFVQSRLTLNFRLGLLVITSCIAIWIVNVGMLSLPMFLGRFLVSLIGLPQHHDPYNILLGVGVIYCSTTVLRKAVAFLKAGFWTVLVRVALQYGELAVRYCVLGGVWYLVFPMLLGGLVRLTIVEPLTVPLNHTPIFFIYQDWAIGLVALKVFHKLITLTTIASGNFMYYKRIFTRLEVEGIRNVDFKVGFLSFHFPSSLLFQN